MLVNKKIIGLLFGLVLWGCVAAGMGRRRTWRKKSELKKEEKFDNADLLPLELFAQIAGFLQQKERYLQFAFASKKCNEAAYFYLTYIKDKQSCIIRYSDVNHQPIKDFLDIYHDQISHPTIVGLEKSILKKTWEEVMNSPNRSTRPEVKKLIDKDFYEPFL